MEELTLREKLHKAVVDHIVTDITFGSWEAADELFNFCPVENLIAFLPDEEQEQFKSLNDEKLD